MATDPGPPRRIRRFWRIVLWSHVAVALAFAVGTLLGGPVSWPFDVVVNLGATVDVPELHVPADGRRRVVVLQHGMWRTPASLGRLARSLRAAGYEVHNCGYPSTVATIQDHAARLFDEVEACYATGPVDELAFVGHSMGGVVIEEYLRRSDARPPAACVYLATPHRGAILADLRKHWWLFRLAMGTKAAMQLSPGDAIYARPVPLADVSGTIVGDLGEGNASIPGHDDGTVAVAEAELPGAAATVTLPVGHTGITTDPRVIEQVLHFLRHRGFAPLGQSR